MTAETTDLAAKSGLTVTEIKRPKPREGKKVPRSISVYTSVDIDVDTDDLHEHGFHHENECPSDPGTYVSEGSLAATYREALESLHYQAHGQVPFIMCSAEPCGSLSLDQLRGVA